MKYFLGIDSGTQSTKAIILSEEGEVCGRGQDNYDLIPNLPVGHKEQNPSQWIEALITSVKEALKDSRVNPDNIAGIGVSGQQHGFVPLDENDKVIRPAKLWCDTSTSAEAEALMEAQGGIDAYIKLTGNQVAAGFTASKILWLKKHEPENFEKLHTVLLPHDYINFWFTGNKKMEAGDASGTALLDVRTRQWCGQAVMEIDPKLSECLPELIESHELCGTLTKEAAEQLGLPEGIPVSAGGGDNMMGAIGTGNVTEGVVTASLGTSGTIYACSDSPVIDEANGEIAAFCDSTGKWLPLLCTMNVTVSTEMVKKTFEMDTETLNKHVEATPPGARGLMLLPYLEGERTPNVPEGTGVWFGYHDGVAKAEYFARAAMEGASLGLGYGLQQLKALGLSPSEIRLTGGGSKSSAWRQILSDVFNASVVCTTEAEGAALGAAIQAQWAVSRSKGENLQLSEICSRAVKLDESTRCEPDSKNVELYQKMQEVHNSLARALRPVFKAHQELR